MTTTNQVELFIITFVLSVYFIIMSVAFIYIIKLVKQANILGKKAELALDNVETMANNFKNYTRTSTSRFPLLSALKKMYDMSIKGKNEGI